MIETRQVSERHKAILELVPSPAERGYTIEVRSNVDDDGWAAAERGTVIRSRGELFLVHDPGDGEVRVRIANRAKAYLYCVEVEDPNTGWRVPLAPSWVISKNYRTVARLVPDHASKRFEIEVDRRCRRRSARSGGMRGTVVDGDLDFEIDGRRHTTSMERLRGEVRLRSRYQRSRGRSARPPTLRSLPQSLQRHRRKRSSALGAERHCPATWRRFPGAALRDPMADARRPVVLHQRPRRGLGA